MALSWGLRILIWLCGVAFFAWAFSDPQFRDAEGFLLGGFCLPVAAGVALMISGWAVTGRLKRFALWFALALVGQAVALQLIEAGPLIHYQHYKPFGRFLTETHPLLLIYLAVQTALVVGGLKNRWPNIRAWMSRSFRVWQLFLIIGLVFFSGAAVSREIAVYVGELFFAAFVQTVNLGNVVLMAWALPEETIARLKRRFESLFGKSAKKDAEPRVDRFAVFVAVCVGVLAAALSYLSYERHPHLADEVVYLYHARYLADGVLTMPAPPVPDAFEIYLMELEKGRWYPSPPPGWPAMLAVGVLLGVPWLVNPVLAGVNVLLSFVLVREIYDRYIARMAVFLMCISPWYVFMGMNFMTHTFTLTCTLVAAVAVAWARKTGKARWGWIGGAAAGMVSLIRPLEGLVVAASLGLWAIGFGARRLKVSSIAAFVIACIVIGAAVLPYNRSLTGNPLVFPIMAYTDKHFGLKSNALGFGPERGMGWPVDPYPGHGPLDSLVNADLNIFSLNTELFGWSTGSLIVIASILFSRALGKRDYLMLTIVAATFVAHIFYWYSGGPDFGARYWYLMLVPLVVLTVRGIQFLEHTFEDDSVNGARMIVGFLSLCLLSLVNYFPWRAIDKYHHYLGMRPDMRHLSEEYGMGRSLVLVRGDQYPDYLSAAAYNPVDLHAEVPVYAWDRGPKERVQVLSAYRDRPVWIVNGPSITHAGYRVIAGPLSSENLLAAQINR